MKPKGLLRVAFSRRLPWSRSKATLPDSALPLHGFVNLRRPVVIGHRGFSAFAPENTLLSFQMAIEAGVDMVELDYRQSADGQLVVIHDAELDRTTDARLRWGGKHVRVEDTTASDIRSLDAGAWFDPKYAGTRAPLLSEALDLIHPRAIALLERKTGDVATTVELLREKHLVGRVVIQSFDWQFLRELHERLPEQPLGALGPLTVMPGPKKAPGVFGQLTSRSLKAIRKVGASLVVWNKQVSKSGVRLAHQHGLKVWVYTVDRPDLAERLLKIGVDGLITNNPAIIWKTIVDSKC